MADDFERIMDGLKQAYRIAGCDHARAYRANVGGRKVWICSNCFGAFNQDPRKPLEEPANGEA